MLPVLLGLLLARAEPSFERVSMRRGHCGITQADSGDCAHDRSSGSFPERMWRSAVRPDDIEEKRLASLSTACMHLCSRCARCRFVSFSLEWSDCSWYSRCKTVSHSPSDFYWRRRNGTLPQPSSPAVQALTSSGAVCFSSRAPRKPLVPGGIYEDAVMLSRALAHGRLEMRSEHVLWMSTFNPNNFAECLFMLVSALTQTHASPSTTWWPLYANGLLPSASAVRELTTEVLLRHLWREGQPVAEADQWHHEQPARASLEAVPRGGAKVRCYAGQTKTTTYSPLSDQYAYPPARAAYSSFQRAVRRHLKLPPLRARLVPLATAAAPAPRAVVMQRRPINGVAAGREILNDDAVLATVRGAGFQVDSVLLPHMLPLAELVAILGETKLLIAVHGASVANAAYMRQGDGALIEVFPPGMSYGSGFYLSMGNRLRHLGLYLRWDEVDLAFQQSRAAFRRSPFADWRCDIDSCADGLWTNDTMAPLLRKCGRLPENFFQTSFCTSIARFLDVRLPLGPLATLLRVAQHHLSLPPGDRHSLHGRVSPREPANSSTKNPGLCPAATILTRPPFHVEGAELQRGLPPELKGQRMVRPVTALLRALGFCVRLARSATTEELREVSLVLSHETALTSSKAQRERPQLPRTAVWLRISPADLVASEGATRLLHRGPQLHGFCAPGGRGERCVVHERLLRTLLRVAKAHLLPNRSAKPSFIGSLGPEGFGPCTC